LIRTEASDEASAKLAQAESVVEEARAKAAQIATVEPGPDSEKRIHQRHFIQGMAEVMAAENVMSQSLFNESGGPLGGAVGRLAEGQEELREVLRKTQIIAYLAVAAALLAAAVLGVSLVR